MIWGVGKVTQSHLAKEGYHTIGQLQTADASHLAKQYGALGLRLIKLAQGEDARTVNPESETKSISAETTFSKDLSSADDLLPILRRLSEDTSTRAKKSDLAGRTSRLSSRTTISKASRAAARFQIPPN